jgi:hypothetical protein
VMTTSLTCRTASRRSPRPAPGRSNPIRPHLPLKSCPSGRKRILRYILIDVYRLGMLSQIVESRKSSRAVALERSFTGVLPWDSQPWRRKVGTKNLPDMSRQMFAASETQITRRVVYTKESLRLLLLSRPCTIGIDTLLIRAFLLAFGFIHVDIFRIPRFI